MFFSNVWTATTFHQAVNFAIKLAAGQVDGAGGKSDHDKLRAIVLREWLEIAEPAGNA